MPSSWMNASILNCRKASLGVSTRKSAQLTLLNRALYAAKDRDAIADPSIPQVQKAAPAAVDYMTTLARLFIQALAIGNRMPEVSSDRVLHNVLVLRIPIQPLAAPIRLGSHDAHDCM